MNASAETLRAPRLTANRLDDLELAVAILSDQIDYLADAVKHWPPGHALHADFLSRHESLIRARDWLAGKIAAERSQRGAE